ncbi:MAG: hypothetical protein BWK78_07055 [Thiotrichaceae bacterium IS1]|nr:MAG: hypothetical protein BWK78_07055 [Thiotrichaceae bacterium IS1]
MTICLDIEENLVKLASQVSGLPAGKEAVEAALRLLIESDTQPRSEDNLSNRLSMDDFRNNPAIGMWKDRQEMEDSVAWVRQLRGSQWTRNQSAQLTGSEK